MAPRRTPRAIAIALTPAFELVLGAVFLASGFRIVFALRLGGVVATLTADRGIHSGDVAAVPLALVGAALLVAAFRPQAGR